jgi:hypothetical protein
MTEPHHVRLARLRGADPRPILPPLAIEIANRHFAVAVRGGSLADLRREAGDVLYRDGYRRSPLRDWPFAELLKLVAGARVELGRLDSRIAPQARLQTELERALEPPASSDDGRQRA